MFLRGKVLETTPEVLHVPSASTANPPGTELCQDWSGHVN